MDLTTVAAHAWIAAEHVVPSPQLVPQLVPVLVMLSLLVLVPLAIGMFAPAEPGSLPSLETSASASSPAASWDLGGATSPHPHAAALQQRAPAEHALKSALPAGTTAAAAGALVATLRQPLGAAAHTLIRRRPAGSPRAC